MLANISSAGYMTPAQEYFEPSEKAITFEASTQSDSSVESSQESSKATQQQAIWISLTILPNKDIELAHHDELKLFDELKKDDSQAQIPVESSTDNAFSKALQEQLNQLYVEVNLD